MEPTTTAHLDPDTLAAYVDGRLAADELGVADRHIDECRSCRLELSTLAAIHTQPVAPQGDAPEGTLGRYHVLRELGRGSMGIVLRAYDPELARPVAIKLVRDVDVETRELLRREARALAKLRHPNVVTVYDVIVEEDALHVAMELVEGDTLRVHCRGLEPRAILERCIRAGKGLAAAHDAGIVHRDFKPENVLCGHDGEVKVSDFGLARVDDEAPDGALAGTPAYMAPEVLRRAPATAASDQFSFCVTVWELLTGERPTGGAPAKLSSAFPAVPAWVIRVLRRGLERDPVARYPSMHALVAALEDDPNARRRRRFVLGAGALAAVATGALIVQLAPRDVASCALDDRAIGAAWSPEAKATVAAAITAASDADTAQRVVAAIDDHASAWLSARRDACVVGRASTSVAARQIACLDRNRREVGELVNILSAADRKLAARAQEAIVRIDDPSACRTATDTLPDEAVARVIVAQGHQLLARAKALEYAGKSEAADAMASQLLAQLPIDVAPRLRAVALGVRARAAIDRGLHDQAEQMLFDALHAAERGHDDLLVARLWVEIVGATGAQKHRFDLALSNARAADAALARIEPSPDVLLRYGYTLGTMLLAHGKLDDARTRLSAALALGITQPRRQTEVALIELALCDVERQRGKTAEAKQLCTSGLKRLEDKLGPNHLRVAVSLSIPGALAFGEHDLNAAEATFSRAVRIFELRDGQSHHAYALGLSNLGAVYSERDDIARARDFFVRSLAMFDRHHPEHPQRLMPLQGLASIALRTGKAAEAVVYYQQIRELRAATYAPEHPLRLMVDYNLALAYRANDQPAEATALLETLRVSTLVPGKENWTIAGRTLDLLATLAEARMDFKSALALREQMVPISAKSPNKLELAHAERQLGSLLVRINRHARAIPVLERALASYTAHGADDYYRGVTRFMLARAIFQSGGDKDKSLALVEVAAQELARARTGDGLETYRSNVATYLKAYRPRR